MAQLVTDIFKQFCEEKHAEDKGRNFNLLQEVYANTELFDLSLYDQKFSEEGLHLFRKEGLDFKANFPYPNFSLPFPSIFMKLNDYVSIFIREYSPNIITGTMYSTRYMEELGQRAFLNVPFTITLNGEYSTIVTDFYVEKLKDYLESFIESTFHLVIGIAKVLNNLPKHTVLADTPKTNQCEYYRRKNAPTIKINKRPIYYIVDKSEQANPNVTSKIHATGKLEFTHAFRVRGHWRTINEKSLGKDRNGNYGIKGYTWVTDYVKGEGELVKKLHIVK